MSQVIVHITTICLALGLPGKKSPSSQVRSLTCQELNFSPPCARFKPLVDGSGVKGCPEVAVLCERVFEKGGICAIRLTYLETHHYLPGKLPGPIQSMFQHSLLPNIKIHSA